MADTNPYGTGLAAYLLNKGLGSISDNIDRVVTTTGLGDISSMYTNNYYGINHCQRALPIPIKKDQHGLTFFTRPKLNLTKENIRTLRTMNQLNVENPLSLERYIRCMLGPDLAREGLVTTPLVDHASPFISILTNDLLSIGGFPDVRAPTHSWQDGIYKESVTIVDGTSEIYSTYDITANFRNQSGSPIIRMMLYWIRYMSAVFQGQMIPYLEMILMREIDYNTRIYRLVLDETRTYVVHISAPGASVPISAPVGTLADYESDHPINQSSQQVSINFACCGYIVEDDLLIDSFNRTVVMFNDDMKDASRATRMVKIPREAKNFFNFNGYPHINEETKELEWWVTPDVYRRIQPLFQDFRTRTTTP